MLIRIRRYALEAREAADRAKNGSAAHPSETELLARPVACELENVEGDPDSLRRGLYEALGLTAEEAELV
jgi:hypothetical protein